MDVTFFVAINDGSMLLSCKTTLALGLIQPTSRLDYLPPKASLITSTGDHPKRTKLLKVAVHTSQQKSVCSKPKTRSGSSNSSDRAIVKKQGVNNLKTSKDQIWTHYPDVFEGIGKFSGPPYVIQLDPSI